MEYDFDFENEIKNLGSCVEFSELNTDGFDYLEGTNWLEKDDNIEEDNYAQ